MVLSESMLLLQIYLTSTTHSFPQSSEFFLIQTKVISQDRYDWIELGWKLDSNIADGHPAIFLFVGDPVGAGVVPSLAHPGGNATGISLLATELARSSDSSIV
jgi:putative tryptophan/tyrosine transport system substrate-binding protein